jgi:hypothetical protein
VLVHRREERAPLKHPLRKIRQVVDDVLVSLDAAFAKLYPALGVNRSRRSGYQSAPLQALSPSDPSAS